jgi:hypothetical protein
LGGAAAYEIEPTFMNNVSGNLKEINNYYESPTEKGWHECIMASPGTLWPSSVWTGS